MTWAFSIGNAIGAVLVGVCVAYWWFRKPRRVLCDRCFLRVLNAQRGTTFSLCYQCSNAGREKWRKE